MYLFIKDKIAYDINGDTVGHLTFVHEGHQHVAVTKTHDGKEIEEAIEILKLSIDIHLLKPIKDNVPYVRDIIVLDRKLSFDL